MLTSTYIKLTLRALTQRALPLQIGTTTTAARRTMSAFSQMSDNDPDVLEKEKLKQMNKKDKKDWHEKLATHSEAAIKADKDYDKSTKELQDESLNSLKDENKIAATQYFERHYIDLQLRRYIEAILDPQLYDPTLVTNIPWTQYIKKAAIDMYPASDFQIESPPTKCNLGRFKMNIIKTLIFWWRHNNRRNTGMRVCYNVNRGATVDVLSGEYQAIF